MTSSAVTNNPQSQRTIDSYLTALRSQLWELTPEDSNDIVEEIRMHILDKTLEDADPQAVAATTAALGTPAELAIRYCTKEMLERGRAAHTPAYIARSARNWALLTLGGLLVFSLSVIGYGLGGFLFMLGILKLLHPGSTGIYGTWTDHDRSFRWQSGGPNTPDELLGWWLLPIGLIVGGALLLLTFKLGTWSIRKFWRPRKWQQNSAVV